ncbi:MAG: hypothetical protein JRH20_24785 [Deltaproteobacteria bacterium]|nr:hypothetical protein [Deltaproteobacteria bacterium]
MALPSPAATTGTTNFDAAMKQIYRPSNVKKLTYEDRPLLALLPKFEGFGGRNMPVVVKWGHPQGRSITFATAQANGSQVMADDFLLTRVSDYSINYIEAEVLEASRGDTHAFLNALSEVIDGTLAALADSIETKLFRQGTGTMATLGADATAANPMVLTLTYKDEVTLFEYNMELVACATDGGTALAIYTAAATHVTVAGVDRSGTTEQITTDGDTSGETALWVSGSYIACQGDLAAAAGTQKAISGLMSWVPDDAPAATAFYGVDRTSDTRLGGLRHDASGGGKLEEHFIKAQSIAAMHGGKPDILAMHHAQMRRLNIELGAKKVYADVMGRDKKGPMATVSFRSVVIEGDYKPINVVAMNKCQAVKAWLLTIEDWLFATLGPATKIIIDDGLRMLRMADQDAFEIRTRFRGNLCTKSPGRNVNITLPAPA